MILAPLILALTVITGDWKIADGALEGQAPQGLAGGKDARRPAAAALLGPDDQPDRIEAKVQGLAGKGQGGGVNAFVLFDIERSSDGKIKRARYAGLFIGGRRAAIGEFGAGGKPEVLADAPCDVRAGESYKLLLTFDGANVALAVDGAPVVAHAFEDRRGAGQGFLTLGRARFQNLVVEVKGQVAYEDHFDGGAAMAAGSMPAPAPAGDGGMSMPGPGPTMKPEPAAMPAASGDGGYAGGTLGPCPGLDGPLLDESWKVPPEVRRAIRRRYLDLLGRGPSEAEVLAAAQSGEEGAVDRLLASEDFWRHWYEDELFYFLLIDQFRPTSEPLISLPARLAKGQADPRAALEEIVISQFFSARNPGNDTFVTVVMEQVLGLKVQEKANVPALDAGKKLYDGAPGTFLGEKGASQADVVRISFGKKEFAERYVERLFRRLTGGEIDAAARTSVGARFREDPTRLAAIVREWVLAPAYRDRAAVRQKSDMQWIQTIYVDLLGGRPDYKEFRETRNALLALADSTAIRLVLGRVMVDSKKAERAANTRGQDERWVKERFLLLLGRPANIEELAAYTTTMKGLGPKDGPRVVLRAIVSSREYQRY